MPACGIYAPANTNTKINNNYRNADTKSIAFQWYTKVFFQHTPLMVQVWISR